MQPPNSPNPTHAKKEKPRRQSPARPACSARTTGTFLVIPEFGTALAKPPDSSAGGFEAVPGGWGEKEKSWGIALKRGVRRRSRLKMRVTGVEPARVAPRDPKSRASASSATPAISYDYRPATRSRQPPVPILKPNSGVRNRKNIAGRPIGTKPVVPPDLSPRIAQPRLSRPDC